jgi:hypothetical protein
MTYKFTMAGLDPATQRARVCERIRFTSARGHAPCWVAA